MAPTINVGEHFEAQMSETVPTVRGAIVIVEIPQLQQLRPYRLVGFPGDRIAIKSGVPIINGNRAVQTSKGACKFIGVGGLGDAELIEEHLPSEVGHHLILNIGHMQTDDVQAFTLPSDRYFVLGDNRDHSGDSRVPVEMSGTGLITASQIVGTVQLTPPQ